ncbi:FtsX-like permease family protein [Plantactinospora sp. KLBMP9567]|uniref:FtsX-like permease family protein n=1 Tax=Plantactinospora sp. KLBMP9567 TaxID=3085900 RepID=UPI002980B789|nr:FtsX-like permease family protein [Plantactinospora sp. KLBMP9567]MDW5328166.1 FtsX-like permease family protein [Plantactinospora sp. KLBMP9567]
MRRWIWLGLRLSIGSGRGGLLRTALMSSGAALGVLLVLASLATVSVAGEQHGRAEARTPVREEKPASPSALRIYDIEDAVGGRVLRRTAVVGATATSPRPPGVAVLPAPGEMVVSPALRDLLATDPRAAGRLPQRVVGTVGPAGLLAPDELLAYVGAPAAAVPEVERMLDEHWPVTGFGHPLEYALGEGAGPDVFTPARLLAGAFGLFVLVPFGVFLATCARLSASTRDRRIAALRLLGVSARQATLVNAVETGVVTLGGGLLGLAGFAILAPLSEGWRIGRLRWYAADLAVPVPVVVGMVTVTVAYAVTIGVLATRPARVNPLAVRRDAPHRRPGVWRVLPLLAGLAGVVLAGWTGRHEPHQSDALLFAGSMLLTGLALPLALPTLGYAAAALLTRLPGTPVWLELATARLRHAPRVAPRLVAAFTVMIYVAGVGSLGVGLVTDDRGLSPTNDPAGRRMHQVLGPGPLPAAELRQVPGVQVVDLVSVPATVSGEQDHLIVGDCDSFTGMFTLDAGESCVDGRTYRLVHEYSFGGAPLPEPGAEVVAQDGTRIPAPEQILHARMRFDVGMGGPLLVTRQAAVAAALDVPPPSSVHLVATDQAAADRAAQVLAARVPTRYLAGDLGARRGFDAELLVTLLVTGLMLSFVLGIGAFAAAAIDRTVERRRDNATLAVVGTSPRTITAGEVGFGTLPLVIGLGLASGATVTIALVLARLFQLDSGRVLDRVAPTLWLAGGALAVGLVLIAVPAWLTQRITAEQLRRP